jgi:hypothetical protein
MTRALTAPDYGSLRASTCNAASEPDGHHSRWGGRFPRLAKRRPYVRLRKLR